MTFKCDFTPSLTTSTSLPYSGVSKSTTSWGALDPMPNPTLRLTVELSSGVPAS